MIFLVLVEYNFTMPKTHCETKLGKRVKARKEIVGKGATIRFLHKTP